MTGSIVKRQGKSTKDGKPITLYYIVYPVGQKQKWEAVPEPRTRKHAEKLLAERVSQINRGEFIEPSRMTFEAFKGVWMEKYVEGQVRQSTLDRYDSFFRVHILPAFGEMELSRIGVEDVQGFKSAMLAKGAAPQSVAKAVQIVRQMLGHAVDWGYIRHNPAKKVKDPRVPKKEMDCLTPEEVRAFLEHVPGRWYAFFLTAVVSGLRYGEILAMKWGNLDWKAGRYFVKETLTKEAAFAEVKTEGSRQPVDLSPACLDALRAHRARQAEEKLQAWARYVDTDLVFATESGTPLNFRNIATRVFRPALQDAGLRYIRFHDLRHTCASLLINQGESPKYVQKQMRHASIQMTFDRYGHLFPEASREAVRRLDAALFGSRAQAEAGNAI